MILTVFEAGDIGVQSPLFCLLNSTIKVKDV